MAGVEMQSLESSIRRVMFPSDSDDPPSNASGPAYRKWRNHTINVLIAFSHIWNDHDVLVTSDTDFLNRADKLAHLGIEEIVRRTVTAT